MTKVLMDLNLLGYRQVMKETLRQVVQYNYIKGIPQPERVDPMQPRLLREDVLTPPEIELIFPDPYNGQDPEEDYIAAEVYHAFGIAAMKIAIWDQQGNVIESGDMEPFPNNSKHWDYLPSEYVPLGTKVIIQVTAMDCMGGIATHRVSKTMGKNDW